MAGSDGSGIYERLQRLLLDVGDINTFLADLAREAAAVLADELSCGITVRFEGNLLTVGSSDTRAERLDETQYRFAGGPCLQSVQTGQIVDVPDMTLETRWPDYRVEAARTGLRCSISLPLTIQGDTFGALNVYGFTGANLFRPDERRELEVFAAMAAGTLRLASRRMKDTRLLEQMEESLRSRTTIDQALGILMATQHCSAAAAFDLLRAQSQNSHRRLRDVAADLVVTTSGEQPHPGRPFSVLE